MNVLQVHLGRCVKAADRTHVHVTPQKGDAHTAQLGYALHAHYKLRPLLLVRGRVPVVGYVVQQLGMPKPAHRLLIRPEQSSTSSTSQGFDKDGMQKHMHAEVTRQSQSAHLMPVPLFSPVPCLLSKRWQSCVKTCC